MKYICALSVIALFLSTSVDAHRIRNNHKSVMHSHTEKEEVATDIESALEDD